MAAESAPSFANRLGNPSRIYSHELTAKVACMCTCGPDAVVVGLKAVEGRGMGSLAIFSVSRGEAAPKLMSTIDIARAPRCVAFAYVAVGIAAIPEGALFYSAGTCDIQRLRVVDEHYSIESYEDEDAGRLVGHARGAVTALACSGQSLYSAGTDMTVRLWDAAAGVHLAVLAQDVDPPSSLSVAPDGIRTVLMAGVAGAGFISIWRTPMIFAGASGLREWCLSPIMVAAAVANCGGTRQQQKRRGDANADSAKGGRAELECEHSFPLDRNRVHTAVLLPGGGAILSASHTGEVQMWDAVGRREIASWPYQRLFGHEEPVAALAVLGDSIVVTASDDRTLRVARCPTLDEFNREVEAGGGEAQTALPPAARGAPPSSSIADVLSGIEQAASELERGAAV